MKKSIIIGIGVLAMAIGGIFFGSKIVKAEIYKYDQHMSVMVEGTETTIYKNAISQIKFNIITGEVSVGTSGDINSVGSYISIDGLNGLEIVGIKIEEEINGVFTEKKDAVFESGKVILGDILYKCNNDNSDLKVIGNNLKVTLNVISKDINANYNLKDNIKIHYKTLPYNHEEAKDTFYKFTKDYNVNVHEVLYKQGSIGGNSNVERMQALNKFFDLSYLINPGELVLASKEGGIRKSIEGLNIKDRNIIYVIDEGAIELSGGNEEILKDSIKRSLEELKKTNPDIKTSLIVYGEEAEIISVDGKTSFSIDTLISEIDKIKSSDKSGNLGDGIRKAKYLINENEDSDSSVVIVSAGNPNYYTQISEGNTSMLETRVNKSGIAIEDKEKAEEYSNNIVNDIIINEEDNTRWYGINYGIEKEELLLNDLIDKFEGNIPNVKQPYYDDFVNINQKAAVQISIKATLSAKSLVDGIVIHDDYEDQDITLDFKKEGNAIIAVPSLDDEVIKVKIENLNSLNDKDEIDVASSNNIKVSLTVDFEGATEPVVFNTSNEIEWPVQIITPYIARTGLFNGRLDSEIPTIVKDIGELDVIQVNGIAEKVLDNVSAPELAIENYYAFGAVVKLNMDSNIKLYYKNGKGSVEDPSGSIYELVDGVFKNPKPITSTAIKLTSQKTYLIVIDDYVETNKIVNNIQHSFEIGVAISNLGIMPLAEDDIKWDEWGITVHPVPKPDHF